VGYALGALGALAATGLILLRPDPQADGSYQVVTRWRLRNGQGLFIATKAAPSPQELRRLGQRLRDRFREEENVVVMVFDDEASARDVRTGSRHIPEERFQAALAHQVAAYIKNASTGQHTFTLYSQPRQVIRY
jgi:hypothetical protein